MFFFFIVSHSALFTWTAYVLFVVKQMVLYSLNIDNIHDMIRTAYCDAVYHDTNKIVSEIPTP